MDLYQGCSYDAPWVKLGPAPGVTSLKHRNKEGKLWNSSSLKQEGVELWSFGTELWYLDLYQFYSYDTPWVKTGPIPGVISWNNSNREGRTNFVGKLTQVSDPGPSWPSCVFSEFLKFQFAFSNSNSYFASTYMGILNPGIQLYNRHLLWCHVGQS